MPGKKRVSKKPADASDASPNLEASAAEPPINTGPVATDKSLKGKTKSKAKTKTKAKK